MIKYLVSIFVLFYCINVVRNLSDIMRIKKCISKCDHFIKISESNDFAIIASEWDKFLKVMPLIEERILTPSLSERDTFKNNLYKVENMKYSLIKQRNATALKLKRSFNPFHAFIAFVSLPSKILKLFGVNLNSFSQVIIDIVGWALPGVCKFIFTHYKDVILSLIESVF